jgi:hypothetical protein
VQYRIIVAFLCLELVTSCSGTSVDGAEENWARKTIGEEGGAIEIAGARVVVPTGALKTDVEVILRSGLSAPAGAVPATSVFSLEPSGLSLAKSAQVVLEADSDALALFTVDALGTRNLPTTVTSEGLEATITEFGVIFAAERNPCGQDLIDDVNNCGACGRSCSNNSGIMHYR